MTASKHKSASVIVTTTAQSPFAIVQSKVLADAMQPQHTYGAASMQTYADGQVAFNTHASADGFLAYVNQFEQTSFRVKDAQVQWWQYSPTFDDWQNNYGCDSVEVFYHAGHGGTDSSTGAYSAPLGASWDNTIFLNSAQMSIGDQRLRYIFLATCEGCMVFAPNDPIRTWNVPNRGMRMLFGATANIYDNANYGTNFWNHWRSGDSFSQAWQDAILDAGSSQQPSSVACGSTAADAKNRLFTERFFDSSAASRNWYWWRWVGNAPTLAAPELSLHLPRHLRFGHVAPRRVDEPNVRAAMRDYGFADDIALPDGPLDMLRIATDSARLAVLATGGFVFEYTGAEPRRSALTNAEIASASLSAISGSTDQLRLDRVLPVWHAGASAGRQPQLVEPEIFEHVAIYRQHVANLPVVTPGTGEVRVHIDHAGRARRIVDTRLDVTNVSDRGPVPTKLPTPGGEEQPARQLRDSADIMRALQDSSRALQAVGSQQFARLLPDSVVIGYALRGTDLVPVARGAVEFGTSDYRMFEAVEVDILA